MKKFSFALAILIVILITACSESEIEEALGIAETYSLCTDDFGASCTADDCNTDETTRDVYSSYDTCEDAADTWNSGGGNNNTSGSGSSCIGNTTPYGDEQLDVQCQAACSYLEVNNEAGVTGSCDILTNYENVFDDVRASDCPACSS